MSERSFEISRRRFIANAGLAATAVCLVPHRLFGDEQSLDRLLAQVAPRLGSRLKHFEEM